MPDRTRAVEGNNNTRQLLNKAFYGSTSTVQS